MPNLKTDYNNLYNQLINKEHLYRPDDLTSDERHLLTTLASKVIERQVDSTFTPTEADVSELNEAIEIVNRATAKYSEDMNRYIEDKEESDLDNIKGAGP